MLSYSKEEIKSIEDNYKMTSKYVIDIIKNYGTIETFIDAYKRCQVNYNFKNDIFCGFRGITISKNDITEYQKLQYALAIKKILAKDINYFEFNTGKYIDIEQFEQMIMTLPERMGNVYRCYSALDGKKYTMTEIGNMYNVSSQRISEIVKKAVKMLSHPSRSKNLVRNYRKDYKEIEEYNKEIKKLESEMEDLQIINDYLSNKDYADKNIELSKVIENKDKLANFNKENIINIQDLIQKYYNEKKVWTKEIEIYELEFSIRTYNCLHYSHINTLYDLINSTENEISKIRSLGKNSYNEIIDKLSSMGLRLRKNNEEKDLNIPEFINIYLNNDENTEKYFISFQNNKTERMEEIISKKEYIQNKTERYYKAVEQYLNDENIFNSEFIVGGINLKKEHLTNFDNIKRLLEDLKIISDDSIVEDENNGRINTNLIDNTNDIKKLEKLDKNIPKIKCFLRNENYYILGITDKHSLELELNVELNKVYNLETEWLGLEPFESIENTIFLQTCLDEDSKNNEKENRKFHIELGYENTEGEVIIYEKDGLTLEEVLQIFINYFENCLPDIKDWHSFKYKN